MIRVVLRHENETEGSLVGDFPPSEIDGLLDRLRFERIYLGDISENAKLVDGNPLQWTRTVDTRPRLVLEVIVQDR